MTCIVPSYVSDDHVHFLDGAGGGYALAAQNLKQKIARREAAGRRVDAREARRSRFGLSTLFGIKPRGFFIPYRYADQVRRAPPGCPTIRWSRSSPPPSGHSSGSLKRWTAMPTRCTRSARTPAEPRWNQDWFPRLDAAAAYVLVRETRPRRIVEVGSGHSTRFLRRAIRDGGLPTAFTAIDPAPRADIEGAGADDPAQTVQDAGPRRSWRWPRATSCSSIRATS